MRGARIACQIRDALVGIIPADAGSTVTVFDPPLSH